jgi:hypothetical protein
MTIVYLSSVFIINIKSSITLSKTAIFVWVKSEEMRYTSYETITDYVLWDLIFLGSKP